MQLGIICISSKQVISALTLPMIGTTLIWEALVSKIRCFTLSLSLQLAKKKKKVICPQVPCMAEELHHVQMFTKVVLLGILFSQFLEENSHVYFLLGFLGHSFKIGLESFFGFRVFAFKNKTKKSNMQQQQQKIRHLP